MCNSSSKWIFLLISFFVFHSLLKVIFNQLFKIKSLEKSFKNQSILVALYLQSTKVSLGLGWFYKTYEHLDSTKFGWALSLNH